jgi:ParB family chromosome partitioning protein
MKDELITRIPISAIRVVNPRSRNKVKWQTIVQSISAVGLKRPITVTRRSKPDVDGKIYDLACGQGRLEAFTALGEETIPAIISNAREDDLLLMSLIENIARRPPSFTAVLQEVRILLDRGYAVEEIASKLGVDRTYIYGVVHLVKCGEEALVRAVEAGHIPLTVAIEVAAGNDQQVSRALSEAYEKGELRGHKIAQARRIITQRIAKSRREGKTEKSRQQLTGDAVVKEYKQKIREQKLLVAKAERVREHLLLLTSAMRTLTADENFMTLLRAEGLNRMPAELAERLQ